MPITINTLASLVNLNSVEGVKWGTPIQSREEGVYIISSSEDPSMNLGTLDTCPLSVEIIRDWINKVGGFKLDRTRTFDEEKVIKRLSGFWLPDENILYIGKAPQRNGKKGIGNRVKEYYKTDYGKKSPHAGGHWLKALSNLNSLYVYYAEIDNSALVEQMLLNHFMRQVSVETRSLLRDKSLTLPFANLELKKGQFKNHGLSNMKK